MNSPAPSRLSTSTYRSFNEIELLEPPASPPSPSATAAGLSGLPRSPPRSERALRRLQARDGGFRSPMNVARHPPSRSSSTPTKRGKSSDVGSMRGPRPRRSNPPSTASSPRAHCRHSRRSHEASSLDYFQFPALDLVDLAECSDRPQPVSPLPQTTHYWTSDSTRRLEYAAIDAASRGVSGWIRRHLVPECFGPRHVSFDEDRGSVRRYRIQLEDGPEEKSFQSRQRRYGWSIWPLRKRNTV